MELNVMTEVIASKIKQNNEVKLYSIPNVAKIVYTCIKKKETLKFKDLLTETNYSERRLRDAIKILVKLNLIEKYIDFEDLRSHYYSCKK